MGGGEEKALFSIPLSLTLSPKGERGLNGYFVFAIEKAIMGRCLPTCQITRKIPCLAYI
jgi:hypothetical protein